MKEKKMKAPDSRGFTAGILLMTFVLVVSQQSSAAEDIPVYQAEMIQVFDEPLARQGVAVDGSHFYVVENREISKHDKETGEMVARWPGELHGNQLLHMDSLMERNGKLYAAHSNYPDYPMTSSIEVWNSKTMEHIESHSFGVNRGSLTWLDWHDGFWWGTFANYDKIQTGQSGPYGLTNNTQVVKFDENFLVISSWTLPQNFLDRIRPMSNSGGSWGADGYLYLTGHDHGEIYVFELPQMGSVLHQVAMVEVPVMEGQGIAWDRSNAERYLWGINKENRKVVNLKIPEINETRNQRLPQPMNTPQ